MSETGFNSGQPELPSPEEREARIAQLQAEHGQLSVQWRTLSAEIRALIGVQGKTPEQIQQDQERLEELTELSEQLYERQVQVEEEMFRLLAGG